MTINSEGTGQKQTGIIRMASDFSILPRAVHSISIIAIVLLKQKV